MNNPQTLKGFRDFLPSDAIKRQYVINKIKNVFELFGFDPLETPALEYAEVLTGKYGQEADKLLYLFSDRGGRKVGLRYDQTVPTARVVAQYGSTNSPQELPMPFKRYQIQPVWRAENPQRGRFREFLQCDADIFGEESFLADAEIIALAAKTIESLGFGNFTILINDRTLFADTPIPAITIIDKLKKIGVEGVKRELGEKGFDPMLLDKIKRNLPNQNLKNIIKSTQQLGVTNDKILFDPTLARGLDYYTSTIFEVEITDYQAGSVCGGGRYDKLIGQFTGSDVPAVGFAFGFDRLIDAMEQAMLLPDKSTNTQVLVTLFDENAVTQALKIVHKLRSSNINTEVALSPIKLEKQLKYADKKGIPFVIIQGPDEISRNVVKLKDMKSQKQEELSLEALIEKLTKTS